MSQRGTVITGRHLGGITFDVTVEESHEDTLEITEHPVEQGAAINDHAFIKPPTVTIRAGASDCSGGDGSSRDLYERLLKLQAEREPFDIVTGKRLYTNMLLETLTTVTDVKTETSLLVSAVCRHVNIVSTQVASVPPRARHKNPGKTGATADKGQKQPIKQSAAQAGLGERGKGHTRPGGAAPGYGGTNG